uniref:Uncharacterized protein n=1 Tax=Ditylenchus dipsaci TaxID=166011 RepID=A0A915CUV5_9BILA
MFNDVFMSDPFLSLDDDLDDVSEVIRSNIVGDKKGIFDASRTPSPQYLHDSEVFMPQMQPFFPEESKQKEIGHIVSLLQDDVNARCIIDTFQQAPSPSSHFQPRQSGHLQNQPHPNYLSFNSHPQNVLHQQCFVNSNSSAEYGEVQQQDANMFMSAENSPDTNLFHQQQHPLNSHVSSQETGPFSDQHPPSPINTYPGLHVHENNYVQRIETGMPEELLHHYNSPLPNTPNVGFSNAFETQIAMEEGNSSREFLNQELIWLSLIHISNSSLSLNKSSL